MRSGLIPVNSKYRELFELSPLSMMITDGDLNPRWTSEGLEGEIGKEDLKRSLTEAITLNENRILKGKRIRGGAVFWQEDLSVLHDMEHSLQMALQRQEKRNEILLSEGHVRGEREALRARQSLMEEMEQRILREIERMEIMTDMLPRRGDDSRKEEAEKIAIMIRTLACYVKRRLNLFFWEKQSAQISADELILYLGELVEYARELGLVYSSVCDIWEDVGIKSSILIHDVFYRTTRLLILKGAESAVYRLYKKEDGLVFKILTEEDITSVIEDKTREEDAVLDDILKFSQEGFLNSLTLEIREDTL